MSTTTTRRTTAGLRIWRVGASMLLAALTLVLLPAAPAQAASARLRALDVTVVERDGPGLVAKVPVRLSRVLPRRVTVDYTTVAGTAKARADFVRTSGTLAIRAGSKGAFVRVPIRGDRTKEPVERFRVKIFTPTRATIVDAVAVVTVRDDDAAGAAVTPPPTPAPSPCPQGSDGLARYARLDDVARTEGWTANNLVKFSVQLSTSSALPVCISWATGNITAQAGEDYTAGTGTLVFHPGETVKRIAVAVQGDIRAEGDETFALRLTSAVNATIPYGVGTGTILNDDCADVDEGRAAATDLGDVVGDAPSSAPPASGPICAGDADWYSFDLVEYGSAAELTARIDLAVGDSPAQTGGDLDLAVYDASGRLVASSDLPGTADEVAFVKKLDTAAVDDTRVFVKVFGYGGTQVNTYTLTVTGNVATGVAPNL